MEIVKQTQDSTCSLEDTLINRGLVNVQSIDPRIKVNLRYSSINNFLRTDMYGCLNKAYFQNETAHKLAQAQEYLTVIDSNLSLLIWNGVRPRSIQRQMWNSLDMPFKEKVRYVSNPKNGSIHNYGCAVDLTICEQDGKLLDMGSDFDYFGPAANTNREYMLMTDSILNFIQFDNRKLLRTVMIRAGFSTISSEWWHFNWMSRYEASRKYAIIE
ncbi:MAG: M15 family metallopeptidase [Bacteroidia bacterium]|nr:M15 family metallopeptidase [Bacteroidia bacterium]NNJ54611.1 M15 family metallopeptidase [Bacteroidia bacterium]